MKFLQDDIAASPHLFVMSGPLAGQDVGAWVASQHRNVPAELVDLWLHVGSGDLFESEELFAPCTDIEHSIDRANESYWSAGLEPKYLVFHAGLYRTAIDNAGIVTRISATADRVTGYFDSIEAWYLDLRQEYGPTYGLDDSPGGRR